MGVTGCGSDAEPSLLTSAPDFASPLVPDNFVRFLHVFDINSLRQRVPFLSEILNHKLVKSFLEVREFIKWKCLMLPWVRGCKFDGYLRRSCE